MTNRIIKFRAWNPNHKAMHSSDDAGLDWLFGLIERHGATVMQFTGLLDRTGKEVYEGDVVVGCKVQDHWTIPKGSEQIYVITWDAGKFHCNDKKGEQGWILDWHTSTKAAELIVIGNIYENPELLT